MFVRLCSTIVRRGIVSATASAPVSQLINERRYLEKLSTSMVFVQGHASPTAIHERDLRYEELLAKAVLITPKSSESVLNSEAWTIFEYNAHAILISITLIISQIFSKAWTIISLGL
jgi:hypothetical protein